MTHSFRAGERGQLHNPEFTIVEWYRVGDDMTAGIDLLDELMQQLLGTSARDANDVCRSVRNARRHQSASRRRSMNWRAKLTKLPAE